VGLIAAVRERVEVSMDRASRDEEGASMVFIQWEVRQEGKPISKTSQIE
jgi:hypothetical protein